MKIVFEDGSFLDLAPINDKMQIVMCGFKTQKQVTMSASELTKEQVQEIVTFLQEWNSDQKGSQNV